MHELAHMWWGERITGAQIQGRWMLTENMADYSTLMLFREYYPPVYINRLTRGMLDGYLNGRSQENEAEAPVMYTERHGYLRAKGPLTLYALHDLIGKEKVHQALRNFLNDYSFQTSPCPASRDLVNALRAEAGPEYRQLIAKHRLRSGKQVLTVRTSKRPGIAALDPFHKRIERSAGNNSRIIDALPITVSRFPQ